MNFLNLKALNRQTVIFAFIALLFLTIIRFSALFLLQTEPSNLSVMVDLFIIGLRFDARIIAIVLLFLIYIPSLFIVCVKNRHYFNLWSKIVLSICLFIILLLSFINFAYLQFFGSVIDILIFGLIEDGTANVIKSILGDFRLIFITAISSIIIFFILKYFLILSSKPTVSHSPCWIKIASLLCLIPIMLIAARGSFTMFPLSKQDTEISNSLFVNSLSQNALYHLYHAFLDRDASRFNGSSLNILNRAQVKSVAELEIKAGFNPQNPLLKSTPINPLLEQKPPHVILVQMEGWSTQIALTDSQHTLGEFNQHRLDDYFFTQFFSNSYGTNPSIEALLLNSPITPLSQSNAYLTPFKMSNLWPFKQNNYRTLFLSGGHTSWRNLNKFWLNQGFDEFIGRASIAKQYGKSDNVWGVYDEYLFSYLLDDLKKQKTPSFYFVLTTNNHIPVELPDTYKVPEFDLKQFAQHAQTKEMLKGYSYQSNAFGQFMSALKNSSLKENVIVIATGDHVLKGFDNYHAIEKTFLKYSVPAYFYVPEQYDLLKGVNLNISGSHNDLFPTIFNLALSNTQYYNFGTPLMHKNENDSYGWIMNAAFIVKNGVVDLSAKKHYTFNANSLLLNTEALPLKPKHKKIMQIRQNQRLLQKYLLYQDKEDLIDTHSRLR